MLFHKQNQTMYFDVFLLTYFKIATFLQAYWIKLMLLIGDVDVIKS